MCCVQLFEKRLFDFSKLEQQASKEVVVVKCAPMAAFREATLKVRVHGVTISGGDGEGQIVLVLSSTAPSEDEPGAEFVGSEVLAQATIVAGLQAGTVFDLKVKPAFARAVRLVMTPTQGGGAGPWSLAANLSAALVVKA